MSARAPRGHVARAIAEGKRPFLTCTVAADTFRTIDRIAAALNISRGRLIDSWAHEAAGSPLQAPEAIDPSDDCNACQGAWIMPRNAGPHATLADTIPAPHTCGSPLAPSEDESAA